MRVSLARVAELAEQVRGVSYGKDDASSTPQLGYLPVLRAGNITDEGLVFNDLVFVPAERISAKQRIRQHDVVIAASSGSLDVVGKAARALADYEGGFGAFCKVLRPGPEVDPGYFAHFFKTPDYRRRVSALAAGININNLRNEHLDDMQIPLPPLPEQRWIAEVLDRAEVLRAKRRAALDQLDTLAQSIFLDLFAHESGTDTPGERVRLESITSLITKGTTPTSIGLDFTARGVPFIRVQNLRCGVVNWEEDVLFISPETHATLSRSQIRIGDVLVSIAGTIGRVAMVTPRAPEMNCNQAVAIVRPTDDVILEYLVHWMHGMSARRQMLGAQVTGTISNLSLSQLGDIRLPVPPVSLQREFARRVGGIETLRAAHRASLIGLDALFASLQHRAFRGEL